MADASYDVVVIGGGQHGLILGCYLQHAGMSTAILERNQELGGGLCGDEVPLPAFLANTCAHWTRFYSHPAYEDFNLRDYGLQLVFPEGGQGMVFDNGTCIVGYTAEPVADQITGRSEFSAENAAKTIAEIAKFSERDAETAHLIMDKWQRKWRRAFWEYYFNPPDPWGVKNPMERLIDDPEDGIDPVYQFMNAHQLAYDLFESNEMRAFFLRSVMVSCTAWFSDVIGLDQLLGVLSLCLSVRAPSIVIGGTHAIAHALQKAFSAMGGQFFVHHDVDKIIIDNGRAKGVHLTDGTVIEARKLVVSSVDVTQTIVRLVGEEHVSRKIAHRAKNIWYGTGVIWGNVAMHEPPKYKAAEFNPDVQYVPRLCWGPNDPEYMRKKMQAEAYTRGFPSKLIVITGLDSLWDKTRAPQGKHICLFEEFSAPASYFTEREWLQIKRDLFHEIIQQWGWYAPNMTPDNVIGIQADTSYDTQQRNINMRDGDTAVGRMVVSQMGRFRPFAEVSRYKTPIESLYISGAGTHYGLGTARSNSYNCFKVIAEDFGLEKIWEKKGRPY